ncbi:hypothetical protein ACOMHN_021899 [Nucella lapillus]
MSSQSLTQAQLSSCSDADFDTHVKKLSVKDLMGLISYLQKEMGREQENFNGLSSGLEGLADRKSRQYKTISADMVKIQGRLTTLMNRTMKCFSQRSRSMHTVNQPSDKDDAALTPSIQSSVARMRSGRVEGGRRPASVAGINGVVSQASSAAPPVGSRAPVMGSQERRPRSKSQILITPASRPLSQASPPTHASSSSSPSSSSPLTHASSQPSLAASSQSAPAPAPPPPEPSFAGLPSVKHLAQTFGARPQSSGAAAGTSTNYRPVIRAQSMAGSDASRRANVTPSSSSSSKVNGVPALTAAAATTNTKKVQGQYMKRTAAPKPSPLATASTPGQTELEKVHARLQSSRELNLSPLPNKPPALKGVNSAQVQNGDREISVFKTNLDRKKSSSSIVLGQKTDFDDGTSCGALSVAKPSQEAQMAPLRKAQSREELYVIESRARMQKNVLLKEIGNRKKSEKEEDSSSSSSATTTTNRGQWGLKGNSLLAQRLQQA